MRTILRFLKILGTFGRYRLDELLPLTWQNPALKACLWPFKRGARPQGERGARLRHALEDLGPIFVKFGQLLSTRPDLLPPDIMLELNELQDNVSPFDSGDFRRLVEVALGQPVETLFEEFGTDPLASASIAQVHTAKLHSGEEVVVKAVRPGISGIIAQDVELMAVIARLFARFVPEARRLRPVEVVREYQQTIFDELDLLREAANASQLKRNFAESNLLYIPEVYWDYCRSNVLVMERIYGAQVTDLVTLRKHGVDIKLLAERGVEIFFTQVFEHNFFHADMHPGNVYVDLNNPSDPTYIALDMAIIGTLSRQDQFYLARNMLAMFRRDYRQVAELHVLSGWVPRDTSVGAFEAAIRTVCEPIFEKPIKDIAFGDALLKLFQTARRFDMPVQPQLVLLQKTLVNIEGLGRQMYPDLDLWATAHPYLERWLRKRFNPRSLTADLKRQAPEWMEKLPDMPNLVYDSLAGMKQLASIAPDLQEASRALRDDAKKSGRRQRRQLIAVLAFAMAAWTAMPHIGDLPAASVLLLLVSLVALLTI